MACIDGLGVSILLTARYSAASTFSPYTARAFFSRPQRLTLQAPRGKIICRQTLDSFSRQLISTIHRRQILPLMGFSLLLALSEPAQVQAKDIPIFGIRTLKKVEEEVVGEAKELVKEGEQEAEKIAGVVKEAAQDLEGEVLFQGPGPVVQAGAVAGAEVIGVLVASSIVNGIVGTQPSE